MIRNLLTRELERKIEMQNVLIEITDAVDKVFDMEKAFDIIMQKLANRLNIVRGMLVLFEVYDINQLSVVKAFNLTEEEMSRGNYRVGEGIIGKVVETGKPISIPDINKSTEFLNRMKVKRNKDIPTLFIAIPIFIEGHTSGVLAIEKRFEGEDILADEQDLIFLIGKFISNKIKTYQQLQKERKILIEENLQLRKELYKNYGISNMIGKNEKMVDVFELVKLVADSN